MRARDLGTHTIKLHEQGGLTLMGEGTHLDLPAHEALDLLNWLLIHREQIVRLAHEHPMPAEASDLSLFHIGGEYDDPDRPVDEP